MTRVFAHLLVLGLAIGLASCQPNAGEKEVPKIVAQTSVSDLNFRRKASQEKEKRHKLPAESLKICRSAIRFMPHFE